MPLFKNKIRSAQGMFSQKRSSDASRTSASTSISAQKGSSSELAPAYVDSVMTPDADALTEADGSGGAFNEPLVLDFAIMHDGAEPSRKGAPLSPVISSVDPEPERRGSWHSEDDNYAPAPQVEFARREIHIPFRTRYATSSMPCSLPCLLMIK
jgi:hypothetical protein